MDQLDHRSLSTQLELYHIQENAPGMPFWHPRGYALYHAVEEHIRHWMRRYGFEEIRTPQLLPRDLWERSGHWQKFRANMFSVDDPNRPMALKPMSCPCHVQVFNQGRRSWRQLPLRYFEFGACHRDEPSGSMHGLLRTRSFVQDDAHIFCRDEDVPDEVARFIGLLKDIYAGLGFDEISVALSTRPAERFGDDAVWDAAEAALLEAARASGILPAIQPGEGAFYGPKLEFAMQDRLGRPWQCGTVQLDYVLPGRLGARYVGPDGGEAVPVMIHHAVLGSLERAIGILLEHHAGDLPLRFAPEQVAVMPLSDEQDAYAAEVVRELQDAGHRPALYSADDTLARRIVKARGLRIPVLAVVGRREADLGTVMLRVRGGEQVPVPRSDVAARLNALVAADAGRAGAHPASVPVEAG
jgi:threonyl-tRNA synthetase